MRALAAAIATILALISAEHLEAGVSEDIVFCSKIKKERERISCYDAAARVAAQAEPTRAMTTARTAAASSGGQPYVKPKNNPVDGAYVFGYVGYTPRLSPQTSPFAGRGPTFGGGLGYNFSSGPLVMGFEARGHWDDIAGPGTDSTFSFVQTLPLLAQTSFGSGPFLPINFGDRTLGFQSRTLNRYERNVGGDLSWRTGITPLDWLMLYGRVGIGAQEFTQSSLSLSSTANCRNSSSQVVVQPGGFSAQYFIVGCNPLEISSSATTMTQHGVAPYLLVGTGLEANFANFFLRVEGEFNLYVGQLPGSNSNTLHALAASIAAGVRF
jgi:opacity protein-like surface antigen